MKPLREHLDDPDLAVRAGAALLSKVQPFELSMTQRRRIRARIDAMAEQPRGMAWLRPAFAVPVLLVVGVAGATVGPRLYRAVVPQHSFEQSPPSAQPAPPVVPAHAPVAHAALPAQPGSIAPEDLEPEKPTPAPHAAPSGPGAALMMEALQARRAGDTARAQQLTLEYQKKYPNGALKEEALAIAFESAAARKDASATRLAQKYLAAFPRGRFRAQAEQVLSNH
jgi:TolA-binding protein